jgi:hypothetical protein
MSIVNFDKNYTGRQYPQTLEQNTTNTILFGDSTSSEYIPFIAGFVGTRYKTTEGKSFVVYNFYYNDNDYEPTYRGARRRRSGASDTTFEIKRMDYANLMYALYKQIIPVYFETDQFVFQAAKGILFEFDVFTKEYKILMVLAVKSDYLFVTDKNNPDLNQFALFVSNDFTTDEKYKNVYNKLKKEYIADAMDNGIDIVYTNNILKHMYKTSVERPKVKTVIDLVNHLNNLNFTVYAAIEKGNYRTVV